MRLKIFLKVIIVLTFQTFFSACYFNVSVSRLTPINEPSPAAKISSFAAIEGVQGFSKYSLTSPSGYRVKQIVGLLLSNQFVNTPKGYRVFLNVNGQIASQEVGK